MASIHPSTEKIPMKVSSKYFRNSINTKILFFIEDLRQIYIIFVQFCRCDMKYLSVMKRVLFLVLVLFSLSCSNDRTNRNPYLQDIGFRFDLNLNLPTYSPLTNPFNPIYVANNTAGLRGIFVVNIGSDQFMAWEASCPNHVPNECSTMILDGQNVVCSCEGYEYNLINGQLQNRPDDGRNYYDLLYYQSTFSGTVVSVSN